MFQPHFKHISLSLAIDGHSSMHELAPPLGMKVLDVGCHSQEGTTIPYGDTSS
jgi:hypothetical protein